MAELVDNLPVEFGFDGDVLVDAVVDSSSSTEKAVRGVRRPNCFWTDSEDVGGQVA